MNATRVTATRLVDAIVLEPRVFGDARGYFFESWNARAFRDAIGIDVTFVQDNESRSQRGVLRGLHYQVEQAQGKLVRVSRGCVFDVCVDLRRSSPTFGQWDGLELSEENRRQLWIPAGFAHGFMTLVDNTEVFYQMSEFYHPEAAQGVCWDDPAFGIQWPAAVQVISARDENYPDWVATETSR